MKLEGIQTGINFENLDKLPGISNYFIGSDKSKWHTNIPQYSKVMAHEVYPGVDMVYYGNQRHLEYDFVVKPGADPNSIHLKYEGTKGGKINDQGDLELEIDGRKVTFRSPQAYQETDGQRTRVEGRYRLETDGGIHFEVGNYDKSKPLVIDPELDYSTYLGANYEEAGQSIAVDGNGDACLTGSTYSTNFPTTSGAVQASDPTTFYSHAFVTELNPAGTTLVFSTYLGGNNNSDAGYGVALDLSGNVYVTGGTGSSTFPTTPGAYQTIGGTFITELNSTGGMVYSTCLENTLQGTGIALGSNGNIYVVGNTNSPSFSTTSGAFQASAPPNPGDPWAFVAELDPTGSGSAQLIYSTFLGGNSGDQGAAIALDSNGNIYVTGNTYSTNFPTTSGAFEASDPTGSGYRHAFATELNPSASGNAQLVYSTYLGSSNEYQPGFGDRGYGIALDSNGNIYVTGITYSTNLPTTSNAFEANDPTGPGFYHAFVVELNPSTSGSAQLVYLTYLGGNNNDEGNGIVVDKNGNIYVTGDTISNNFPTTPLAFQAIDPHILTGVYHAFVTELIPSASGSGQLGYSTYLGGNDLDKGYGIALDSNGNIYVTGSTQSVNFPTTLGAYQASDPTGGYAYSHAFVTKFDALDFLTPTPSNTPTATPTSTITNTATDTGTFTPTATNSPTATPTDSATFTPTQTGTIPTDTPTDSPTLTPTLTPTASTTATPTLTVTDSATATPSLTSTDTPSLTPSPTGLATLTPTDTPSSTFTATPTSSSSPTPTNTTTSSPTSSPTLTPSATVTGTVSATPPPSVTIATTPVLYPNPIKNPGPVNLTVSFDKPQEYVTVKVFTVGFSKIYENTVQNVQDGVFHFNLDPNGFKGPAANGLYYVVVTTPSNRWICKLLILK